MTIKELRLPSLGFICGLLTAIIIWAVDDALPFTISLSSIETIRKTILLQHAADVIIRNNTKSLSIVKADYIETIMCLPGGAREKGKAVCAPYRNYSLTVMNNSKRPIESISIATDRNRGANGYMLDLVDNPLVDNPRLNMHEQDTFKTGSRANGPPPYIAYIVFYDGTFEGDATLLNEQLSILAATRKTLIQIKQTLDSLLKNHLNDNQIVINKLNEEVEVFFKRSRLLNGQSGYSPSDDNTRNEDIGKSRTYSMLRSILMRDQKLSPEKRIEKLKNWVNKLTDKMR